MKKLVKKLTRILPDKLYLKLMYKRHFHKKLNLKNPQTFNEKLQWLKLYDRKPIYTTMVDKYAVKKYVSDILGEEYIIPTLGVWDKFDDIDFDKLPNQFVLKTTHGSGGYNVFICKEKQNFDIAKAKSLMEKSLKSDTFWYGREWPYKNVPKKIIAEKFMEDGSGSLVDYKFFCFNGEVKFLYISRGLDHHDTAEISFFDLDGNETYFSRDDFKRITNFTLPENWEDLKMVASKLAKQVNVPFIRVDLYSINGKIYFSELTFSPCSGYLPFNPKSADLEIGKLLTLPELK